MKGYANLYHAIADIKSADIESQFEVLCTHENKGFVGFESADFFEIEPQCSDENFIKFCLDMVMKYKVNVIFASQRQGLLIKNKQKFRALGAEVVTVANEKMINSINNKSKLYTMLKGNSVVKIPTFKSFGTSKEFNKTYDELRKIHKQLCIKPLQGVYGVGFYVLKESTDQLKNQLSQSQIWSVKGFKKSIKNRVFKKMMLMQFLEGNERSVDCVAYHGDLIGGVIRKKLSSKLPQVIEDNPKLIEQVKWLTKRLNLNGMYNIQFRDCNGEHYLLEINTRLSGRSFYATMAGLNLPYVASLVFSGLKKPEEIIFKVDKGMLISAVTKGIVIKNKLLSNLANSMDMPVVNKNESE